MTPILLTERKPEPISRVLVWKNTSLTWDYAYYFNNDKWLIYDDNGSYWLHTEPHIKILLWMPLPEPPSLELIKSLLCDGNCPKSMSTINNPL